MFGKSTHWDNNKFKALFTSLYPRLCLFANAYVKDMELCKDLVQEVFVKMWEKQHLITNQNTVKAYLYTSVKNKCLDYLKSKKRKVEVHTSMEELVLETEGFFMEEMAQTEIIAQLKIAIDKLPNKCRNVLKFSMHQYSNKEISEELSISVSNVKSQKRIAYQKLKEALMHLNNWLF